MPRNRGKGLGVRGEAGPGVGANEIILEKFLAAAPIKTNPDRIESLSRRVESAIHQGANEEQLSFLRYVGRKFAIKAMRAPEQKDHLLARQKKKQFNFLKKMRLKLYENG